MIRTLVTTSTIALMLTAGAIAQTDTTTTPGTEPTVGQQVDNAIDNAGEAVDNASQNAGEALDNAGQAVDNAMDNAGQAIDNAVDSTGAAINDAAASVDAAMSPTWDWATGYTIGTEDIIVNDLLGAPVYSTAADDAEEIGKVNDLVITADGDINAVIIGVGGFLGIGEKNVAVDYASLDYVVAADNTWRWVLGTTREALESAPEFIWQNPRDPAVDPAMAPADPAMPPADPAAPVTQ
jgi:sporulation protein YlmC with PRC-barrel domain